MTAVLRSHAATGVELLQDDDGRYRVQAGEEVVVVTRVRALAEVDFEDAVERLGAGARRVRENERQHYEMQAVRSDSFAMRAAAARKKGGRGGRGGV